jgi:hypothetical protein
MNRICSVILASVLVCAGCASAQGAQDAKPPVDGAHGRQAALNPQSTVDQVLEALERRGQNLRSLRADVKLTELDNATNDSLARSGSFALENRPDGSTRAHVVFDRKIVDKRTSDEKIEYVLDGVNVIDRNYNRKIQTTRQVLRPGEKMNLLKLGEGPFPLPIGQKREHVLKQFYVNKIDSSNDDPANSIHLELTPMEGTSLARKFKSIDTWVNVNDELPLRIKTLDFNGTTERTTDLANVQINADLKDADFALPKIDEKEWNLIFEPLRDSPLPPPDKSK